MNYFVVFLLNKLSKSWLVFGLLYVLILNNVAHATIIETNKIEVIQQEALKLTENDLITFDVKGVLLTPKDQLLSPHFKAEYKAYHQKLKDQYGEIAAERFSKIILLNYEAKLVDQQMPKLIREIKKKGIKTIAVTSGYAGEHKNIQNIENLRIATLAKFGIDFSSSFPVQELIIEKINDKILILYKKGIIFTSRALKGKPLKDFLAHVGFKPKKIIHVDNSIEMLHDIEKFCQQENIPFLGIYFTQMNIKNKVEFNKKIADKQIELMKAQNIWVSDTIAECIVENNLNVSQCLKQDQVTLP
jgi:hypothetical protein